MVQWACYIWYLEYATKPASSPTTALTTTAMPTTALTTTASSAKKTHTEHPLFTYLGKRFPYSILCKIQNKVSIYNEICKREPRYAPKKGILIIIFGVPFWNCNKTRYQWGKIARNYRNIMLQKRFSDELKIFKCSR